MVSYYKTKIPNYILYVNIIVKYPNPIKYSYYNISNKNILLQDMPIESPYIIERKLPYEPSYPPPNIPNLTTEIHNNIYYDIAPPPGLEINKIPSFYTPISKIKNKKLKPSKLELNNTLHGLEFSIPPGLELNNTPQGLEFSTPPGLELNSISPEIKINNNKSDIKLKKKLLFFQ